MTDNIRQHVAVTISPVEGVLEVPTAGAGTVVPGGEANTASNIGDGEGLFAQKQGVDLQFKTIEAGTDISFTVVSNKITINSSAAVGAVTSVFGRTGDVAAFQDDYAAGLIENDSDVLGATVQAALNWLLNNKQDAGTLADHAIGGVEHQPSTIAELNTKVTDRVLDGTVDPRDPNPHYEDNHWPGKADKATRPFRTVSADTLVADTDNTIIVDTTVPVKITLPNTLLQTPYFEFTIITKSDASVNNITLVKADDSLIAKIQGQGDSLTFYTDDASNIYVR